MQNKLKERMEKSGVGKVLPQCQVNEAWNLGRQPEEKQEPLIRMMAECSRKKSRWQSS